MGGEFQALLDWLKANNESMTLLAALAAVGIATISMLITIPIWLATRRQAILTRQAFEAGHTPYVHIRVEEPTDAGKNVFSFNIVLENQSAVLAHIIKWEMHATLTDLELKDHHYNFVGFKGDRAEGTLAPGQRKVIQPCFLDERLLTTDLPFRLVVMLVYRGSGSSIYITDFHAFRGNVNREWSEQNSTMRRPEDMLLSLMGFRNN